MKIILSAAVSADGYLDDTSPRRRVLSNPEDLRKVHELRAACDAILVGAETVRRDNPSLITRDEALKIQRIARGMSPDPVKITITRSGNFNPDAKFFRDGEGQKIVYSVDGARIPPLPGETVPVKGIHAMLADLEKRDIRTLLVEGGADILRQFLTMGMFDEFRLATAPVTIGEENAPRLDLTSFLPLLREKEREQCGETAVTHYAPSNQALLTRAVELSFLCPPSEKAYSVGAVIAAPDGTVLATGYSREWSGHWHAEEIAIEKARGAGISLKGMTIYSSMEPCHPRLSGKKSCAMHIIESGIARVVFCVKEPPHFVECAGEDTLKKAGVTVAQDKAPACRVRQAHAHMPGEIFLIPLADKNDRP